MAGQFIMGTFALEIGGTVVGFVNSVEGGAIRADVIEETLGPDGIARKHLGALRYEGLVIEVSLPLARELFDWTAQTWSGLESRRDVAILDCDFNRKVKRVRRCFQSLITEVRFPALDASTREAGYLTIKFRPELIRVEKGDGSTVVAKGEAKSKKWVRSNFRFALGGLDGKRVKRIDAFAVKQALSDDALGEARGEKTVSAPRFPDLSVAMSQKDIEGWEKWANEFIVQGNSGAEQEKSGSIEFLDASLKEVLGRIDLSGVGIFRIADAKGESSQDSLRDVEISLYVEQMALSSDPRV